MPQLAAGDQAPAFEASDQDGKRVALRDLLDRRRLVLYFFPKADTAG